MRSAVIRKRASSIEGVREHSSLIKDSRVPKPTWMTWRTRGAAVATRAPRPSNSIAWADRHRRRREEEPAIANCYGNRGAARNAWVESHE
jgi:hypothetical protein